MKSCTMHNIIDGKTLCSDATVHAITLCKYSLAEVWKGYFNFGFRLDVDTKEQLVLLQTCHALWY